MIYGIKAAHYPGFALLARGSLPFKAAHYPGLTGLVGSWVFALVLVVCCVCHLPWRVQCVSDLVSQSV